ncbi:histone deacetylase family protein [Brucella grignonensis]|uniref:Acetylpolyamine aminohydrolase n=1 Tax=Brucella grignonensis TaxID=94627 RepID=A0A256F1S6_9HYPH|nr:histone deacetylase family protein [Brucella grignonensis]OYR08371.1 acetylpolyamine aminohydrolase [Brucella grignonensis]
MNFIFSEAQRTHDPRHFLSAGTRKQNPEVPERIDRLLSGAKSTGLTSMEPADYGMSPISAVHTPEYLHFMQNIHNEWCKFPGAADEVIPNIHPARRDISYPLSWLGRAGYHMADTSCPISADTWSSAYWSAQTAVEAARHIQNGSDSAYALCRPPGHHAFNDMAGGFCFLNNSAIAAQQLRQTCERVAILDVDLHHGNGTQGVFYSRKDVLTLSIHVDPTSFYPFFWGHSCERGEGEGLGYNLNIPLSLGSGDDVFLNALKVAIARIHAFQPDALVIALGLDASSEDPFGGLTVTNDGFSRIGAACGDIRLPTVIVQEGGYLSDALGKNLTAFLSAFLSKRIS